MAPSYQSPTYVPGARTMKYIRVRLIRSTIRKTNKRAKEAALHGLGLKKGRARPFLGRTVQFEHPGNAWNIARGGLLEVHGLVALELLDAGGQLIDIIDDPGLVKSFLS